MCAVAKVPRALLADDHPEILKQVANVISTEFEIVGSVANGLHLIAAAPRLNPDVVVLDISMPGMDSIEAAWQLQRVASRTKLVFLSVHEHQDYARAAFDAGGSACVARA